MEAAVLNARARGYDSVLKATLAGRGIPTSVYTQLLATVQAALPRTLHKYMALRRRLLGAQSPTGEAFKLRPWDVRAGEPRPFVRRAATHSGRGGGGLGTVRASSLKAFSLHRLLTCSLLFCATATWGCAARIGTPLSLFNSLLSFACFACHGGCCVGVAARTQVQAPLIPGVELRFPYDAGRAMVVESVAPMGKAYQDMVRKGLYEERWVDIFPNRGKRSGAYSGGAHETLPFILLNYEDSIVGVMTLAHEVGHSAHSALARAAQPAATSGYSLFIAGTPAGS